MRKHFYLITLLLVVSFINITAIEVAYPYDCGDADGLNGIDIDDVVFLINYIFNGGPAPDPDCCQSDCPPIMTDYDGNMYFTIKIGDQCWMAQNLKVTHYRNGDPIPHVAGDSEWNGLSTGAYCSYDNDEGNVAVYGRLYNWYAINDSRNIAPDGWHVPSDAEWQVLVAHLGGNSVAGGKLKEAGTSHWLPPNIGATNESGFSGLPGGYRSGLGYFTSFGSLANLWSSTVGSGTYGWSRALSTDNSEVFRGGSGWLLGLSVRCVKD